jgi:hypothetical protein
MACSVMNSHLLETVSWISQCQSTQLSTVFSTVSKILWVENGEVAVDDLGNKHVRYMDKSRPAYVIWTRAAMD